MIAVGELAARILNHFSEKTYIYRQELGVHYCLAFFLVSESDWWFFLRESLKRPMEVQRRGTYLTTICGRLSIGVRIGMSVCEASQI
jgi:hypothetical protein